MEIKDIKEKLTIGVVLSHYGIQVNKNNHCSCPFHDDKTPSMQVYPETNTVHCFSGNCEQTGKAIDVIDFILHKEARGGQPITKHEAILKAKSLLGETHQIKAAPQSLDQIFKHLQESLKRSKKAQAYLSSRNITPTKHQPIGHKAKSDRHLIYGMNDCIIFPLRDRNKKAVSLYGRSILSTTTQKHYYQKERTGLYPHYPAGSTRRLLLTESVIDACTIKKYTDYEVLALYGTNGLTAEHLLAIQSINELEEIIFFLDGDEAGRKATAKYIEQLQSTVDCKLSTVDTPEGEDANSLVESHEPAVLNHLIETRITVYTPRQKANGQQPIAKSQLNTDNPEYIIYQSGTILISILGGIATHPIDKLKVTLKIERTDTNSPLHKLRHSLDLYHDDQVEKLNQKSSERLELGSREVRIVLAELTEALEAYRAKLIAQQKPQKVESRQLSKERKQAAIKFLQSKDLLKKTNILIGKSGMIGEETNRLLMYLVFTSRLREQPLHIISLGSSGTGKTYLQEKISELIPEEHKLEITALSENALYYFERTELKHKLVLIEDLDGANDDKVLFAIRELQSKKRISKTIPIKDAKGNLKTITLQVEGPITLAGTTTREKLYEDNANRSLLIYLDNTKTHRDTIMNYQRALSAGAINRTKEAEIKTIFKDMQSILKPIQIRNPYATKLIIPETVFKPLRTNTHYLNFIEVITFYKQYQRKSKIDTQTGETYIETTIEDIAEANHLLKEVLLAKSDELTKGCRDFFERMKKHLQEAKQTTFYSQEIRQPLKMSPNNLKYYLSILVRYHLIKIIGGHPRKKGYEYEIISNTEYNNLQNQLTNALDAALSKIKKETAG